MTQEAKVVYIQGVGAALETAVNIALDVQAKYIGVSLETETFTQPVQDEVVNGDGVVTEVKQRLLSGVCIKITKAL